MVPPGEMDLVEPTASPLGRRRSSLSASAARRAAMATIRCVLDYLEMDGWMDSNE
jgi:hypothetical protein